MNKDILVFAISQSGETIDTLAALRESKRKAVKLGCDVDKPRNLAKSVTVE